MEILEFLFPKTSKYITSIIYQNIIRDIDIDIRKVDTEKLWDVEFIYIYIIISYILIVLHIIYVSYTREQKQRWHFSEIFFKLIFWGNTNILFIDFRNSHLIDFEVLVFDPLLFCINFIYWPLIGEKWTY